MFLRHREKFIMSFNDLHMDGQLMRRIFAALCVVVLLIGAPALTSAQSLPSNVVGWSVVLRGNNPDTYIGSSPDDACRAAFESWVGTPTDSTLLPATPINSVWYGCNWTTWHDGMCVGNCPVALPPAAAFSCQPGYVPGGYNRCVKAKDGFVDQVDDEDQPKSCGLPNPQGKPISTNVGKSISTRVGNPVSVLSGAKQESFIDFATDDGLLRVERFYSTRANRAFASVRWSPPLGAAGGWGFSFRTELHIGNDAESVSVHFHDGLSFDFYRDGNAFLPDPNKPRQYRYSLALTSAAPTDWHYVFGMDTTWALTDAETGTTWNFRSTFGSLSKFHTSTNPADPDDKRFAQLTSIVYRGGYTQTFTTDSYGAPSQIVDSYGRKLTITWNYYTPPPVGDPSGCTNYCAVVPVSIKEIGLPTGAKLTYAYESYPGVASAFSGAFVARMTSAKLLNSAGTALKSETYVYENLQYPEHLTGIVDANGGRYSTFAYDAEGRAISTEHAGGVDKYTIAYDPPDNLPNLTRTVTNPLGKQAVYTWNADNFRRRFIGITGQPSASCPGSARSYTYDEWFITSETDEEGRLTTYQRNARGLPTSITRGSGTPLATTTTIQWHASLNMPTSIATDRLTTTQTVNSKGLVSQIQQIDTTSQTVPYSTNGQTRTWAFAYNAYGKLTSVDGPLAGTSDKVTYTYTAAGAFKTYTNEMGKVVTATAWSGRGQPTSITDSNGVVTTLAYENVNGKVTQIKVDATGASPSTTTIAYNAVGLVSKITYPDASFESYTYDSARRLTKITNAAGETVTYARNANGDATSITAKRSNATTAYSNTRNFDELGRLIKSIGASSQAYSFGYDRSDNLTSVTDPRSKVFSYGFDSLNRLTIETDEGGAAVNISRDSGDDIGVYQDARALSTTFVRNGFGEIIREVSPDRGTTTYVRDARGLVTQRTDPRAIVTNYAYDAAGRLTAKSYAGKPQYYASYTWDVLGNGNYGNGRLVSISDESGIDWNVYDAKGRIQTYYRTSYPAPAAASYYNYDSVGRIVGMSYPSGRFVSYSRDAMGRISGMVTWPSPTATTPTTIASSVTWNPYGGIASVVLGNGLTQAFTYDTSYRVTRVQVGNTVQGSGAWLDRSLTWSGNLPLTIADNQNPGNTTPFVWNQQSQNFTYTAAGRLASAKGYYGTISWLYDANGNRTRETLNGVISTYTYPTTSNRLTKVTPTGGTARNFTYDAAGNTATDSRTGALGLTYQHDVEGRLSKVYQTNNTAEGATYAYDARGRLSSRTVTHASAPTSTTTVYVHDLNDHIIAELNVSGQTQREYIWLDDMPVAVVDNVASGNPVIYYVHVDHLMRPARMTAQDTSWVWDVIYAPFGGVSYIWSNPANIDLRFPGQWFQLESGLAYNWHRHYDATLGRFVQPDPIGLRGERSLYGYVGASPLAAIDSTGLKAVVGAGSEVLASLDMADVARAAGNTCEAQESEPLIKLAAKKKSPTFYCQNVDCGAPHGGLFSPLCPDCETKRKKGLRIILENGQEATGPDEK